MRTQNFVLTFCMAFIFSLNGVLVFADESGQSQAHEHDNHADDPAHDIDTGHHKHEPDLLKEHLNEHNETEITLSLRQKNLAGIEVQTLMKQNIQILQSAPAEIVSNAYQTFVISNPIESQVIIRFKSMGDTVKKTEKLITLFSKDMAKAQSDFLTNSNVWQRVKKLPPHTLSIKELDAARIQFEESRDQLFILGMSKRDIQDLAQANDWILGQYHLYASSDGIVLSDNAPQGSILAVGHRLFEISNEDSLWVEARLPANSTIQIKQHDEVRVRVNNQEYIGKVIQNGHSIDPNTRTRLVRLNIDNPQHQLHAGQYAQVFFSEDLGDDFFKVSQSALMQSPDGDWIIFIEKSDTQYAMQEITLEKILDDGYAISGLNNHTRVVSKSAFFLLSETMKSSFDVHNH